LGISRIHYNDAHPPRRSSNLVLGAIRFHAAAICHGPQLLAAARVLNGRKVTSYPAVGPDLVNAGAEWVDVGLFDALVDGNLVTAQAWPAHPKWLAEFVKVLGAKIEI